MFMPSIKYTLKDILTANENGQFTGDEIFYTKTIIWYIKACTIKEFKAKYNIK